MRRSMDEFSNSCRLCMWKGDEMIPIFASEDDDEIAAKIRKCLPLEVRWNDRKPKVLCANCLHKVETFYEFHCSSVRVDTLYRRYFGLEIGADLNSRKEMSAGF